MADVNQKRIIDLTVEELVGVLDERYLNSRGHYNVNAKTGAFLKVKECAELTGYAEDYIRQLVFKKRIPFTKLNNGSLRFIREDIFDWMKANKRIPTEDAAQQYIENSTTTMKGRFSNK